VKYTLHDVVVSSYETVAGGGGNKPEPEDSITLTFGKIEIKY
jgi:type VI protein secretion system component Hcp